MSVTSFKEIHNGRDGGVELQKDGRTITRYTRVFRATTDSNNDDAAVILNYVECPVVGDSHNTNALAYCQRVTPRNESFAKTVWIVTAVYSTEREVTDNPLAEPADITWDTTQFQRVYWQDRSGNGIVNSAGDPFDPPVEGDDSRWEVQIKKNVASVPTWIDTYRDSVNNATVVIDGISCAAGTAKIQKLGISNKQERNGVDYRVLSLSIAIDAGGWAKSELDRGFRELDGTTGNLKNIRNESDMELITTPALLDGSGSAVSQPAASDAVFIDFNIYNSKDFSELPLN